MKNIKELIKRLDKKLEDWDAYFENQSKITHLSYCRGGFIINEEGKEIEIWCDNDTKFNQKGMHEENEEYEIDGWLITISFIHAYSNLVCLGYCDLFENWMKN